MNKKNTVFQRNSAGYVCLASLCIITKLFAALDVFTMSDTLLLFFNEGSKTRDSLYLRLSIYTPHDK